MFVKQLRYSLQRKEDCNLCNYEPYQEPLTYTCYDAERSSVNNIILHLVFFNIIETSLNFQRHFPQGVGKTDD
jgi:hypothetical protein